MRGNVDGIVCVRCGCFSGTVDEFIEAVQKTHGDNRFGREYRIAADYFRALLLEKRGQSGAARSEYERFLILHPDSTDAKIVVKASDVLSKTKDQLRRAKRRMKWNLKD